ncbi:zeta toxin family protein [Glaesserella parasuis]|nr:zeta toxin family protein [Glaesserella parasuis]
MKKATENRLNIIYETTFNNIDTAIELLSELKNQDYQIYILTLPSNTELSIMRNRQRFEDKRNIEGTLPRIVEREVIERMAVNYQQCLEQLKQDKNIYLYQIKDHQEVNQIVRSILQNNG